MIDRVKWTSLFCQLINRRNELQCYMTLVIKGLPGINTLAYWAHSKVTKKIKFCEYCPRRKIVDIPPSKRYFQIQGSSKKSLITSHFVKLRLLPPKGTFRNKVVPRKLLMTSYFCQNETPPSKGTFRNRVASRKPLMTSFFVKFDIPPSKRYFTHKVVPRKLLMMSYFCQNETPSSKRYFQTQDSTKKTSNDVKFFSS